MAAPVPVRQLLMAGVARGAHCGRAGRRGLGCCPMGMACLAAARKSIRAAGRATRGAVDGSCRQWAGSLRALGPSQGQPTAHAQSRSPLQTAWLSHPQAAPMTSAIPAVTHSRPCAAPLAQALIPGQALAHCTTGLLLLQEHSPLLPLQPHLPCTAAAWSPMSLPWCHNWGPAAAWTLCCSSLRGCTRQRRARGGWVAWAR
jgi:hypothetical protein